MISLKDLLVYVILSSLTLSGIYFSADKNISNYFSQGLLFNFTNYTKTEPATYYKILNSTHCIEKINNAGTEIEIIFSVNYFKILYNLPNITYIFELNDKFSRNYIQVSERACEKIESPEGSILRVKSKNGMYEWSIINGSINENLNGIYKELISDAWKCRDLLNQTKYLTFVNDILNVSSCFRYADSD